MEIISGQPACSSAPAPRRTKCNRPGRCSSRGTKLAPIALDTKTVATASLPVLPLSKVTEDVLVRASPAPFVEGPLGLARAWQSSSVGPKYSASALGKAVR
jgi:hypothetical protein